MTTGQGDREHGDARGGVVRWLAESEEGSASLQVAIYTPVLFFLVVMIVFGGHLALTKQAFTQVASAAARTASLASTNGQAQSDAQAAARDALTSSGLHCDDTPTVSVAGSVEQTTPAPGQVMTATVTCRLSVSDSWVPISTVRTMTATASSPVDSWRAR